MAKLNTKAVETVRTHEGGRADTIDAYRQLRRSVATCLLWEDTFYEDGVEIGERIASLVPKVEPEKVADLAIEARNRMHLRHAPLLLCASLCAVKGASKHVERALYNSIQRADELTEFLAIYWRDGRKPIAAAAKRALADAFNKFDAYQLAKYDRKGKIKLRDVMRLVHPKPDPEREETFQKLIKGELEPPDTWEVALSTGKNKKESFERLMREQKLGALAFIRNLRNMVKAGVDRNLIRAYFEQVKFHRILPFQFVTAARMVPDMEPMIESAMLRGLQGMERLSGRTCLLIDVSGSMNVRLSARGISTRLDAASGLAILLREICRDVTVLTFSLRTVDVPPRRGFALRDAINGSQFHSGTMLRRALSNMRDRQETEQWDRVIVVTDEQSHDGSLPAFVPRSYMVNVAPYKLGVGYRHGWTHIDGWSEHIIDYIREIETQQ